LAILKIAAYGWGVYGIGEHPAEYWESSTTQMFKSWLAIDNFNECGIGREINQNIDVMGGIMHINNQVRDCRSTTRVLPQQGYPETYLPKEATRNCNALERVAVLSDAIAKWSAGYNGKDWKDVPNAPGRRGLKCCTKVKKS
jgi:hypothetical protein